MRSELETRAAEKEEKLLDWFRQFQSALIAYSGGVDSTYVLYAAHRVFGESAVGISSFSETVPQVQKDSALENVKIIGAPYEIIYTEEMQSESFRNNNTDRCFHCKDELYGTLKDLAAQRKLEVIVDGTNADDVTDFRPGRKAAEMHGVRSPLVEIGMKKEEIRVRSKLAGLSTWNIPASACLSSRIPHQTVITLEKLQTVEKGEDFLRTLGFRQIRVRHHEKIVRIEIAPEEIQKVWQENLFGQIVAHFKSLGFKFVTLDLEGYRSGSLNE